MEANRDQAVGVTDLGNMGSGVAARLVEVGFPVLGFDISEEHNRQRHRHCRRGGRCSTAWSRGSFQMSLPLLEAETFSFACLPSIW